MERLSCTHQPTLRQLLATESMAEAQLVWGEEYIDRPVVQVVTQLDPPPPPGSLLVVPRDSALAMKNLSLKSLAGITLVSQVAEVKPGGGITPPGTAGSAARSTTETVVTSPAVAQPSTDSDLKALLTRCRENGVPLILMENYGDAHQTMEDLRGAFQKQFRTAFARVQSVLLSVVLEEGLDGLIDQLHEWIDRPIAIETADFKLLGARGMSGTPPRQQKHLTDEALDTVNRLKEAGETNSVFDSFLYPLKLGRRLSLPLLYAGNNIAGYISVMVKPSDNEDFLIWFLHPAALAAMVDIIHRSKGDFGLSIAQKNVLKDLMSGRTISAADQERLERHFGFDLSDGFFVFAVECVLDTDDETLEPRYPEEPFIGTEIEGTRVYVVSYNENDENTWEEEASTLVNKIKEINGKCVVQLGAGRQVTALMELREAYREARQALIVGSMIHKGGEFSIGYGTLGVKRLLYLIIDHPEAERFYKETLEPLEAYDEEWETDLTESLRVYVNEGANLNSTARALFIHRHTLRYRLEQIADILKIDIDLQEVLLNFQIAFLIREMKGTDD